jgi:hypothetical protein
MASNISLVDFANRPRSGRGWVDDLPDDVFNELWDAIHGDSGIGGLMAAKWLISLGYTDASMGKVATVRDRERR